MHNISVFWSPQGNQIVHRWNVDTDLIWYISSVTKPFLLCWILKTLKERMTRVLTASLEKETVSFRHIFSPYCSLYRWGSAVSLLLHNVCHPAVVIFSLSKLAPTMPAKGIQLDRVGGESAVGNHLLAKGTDGTNISKMFMQQRSKKSFWQADKQIQKPEKPTGSWGSTASRFDAESWQPGSKWATWGAKHWSLCCFHRQDAYCRL